MVREAAEQVEQFSGRQGDRLAGVVMGHAPLVTEGAADRDGGSSSRRLTPLGLSACRATLRPVRRLEDELRRVRVRRDPPVEVIVFRPLDAEQWPGPLHG